MPGRWHDQDDDTQGKGRRDMAREQTVRWISDSFDGYVVIHDVEGDAMSLYAGDPIPVGHEGKVLPHIPTTEEMPRSQRIAAIDAGLPVPPGTRYEFNPGEHTVREVNEYLDQHPDDVQRVLDWERGGKARHGVLTGREPAVQF